MTPFLARCWKDPALGKSLVALEVGSRELEAGRMFDHLIWLVGALGWWVEGGREKKR